MIPFALAAGILITETSQKMEIRIVELEEHRLLFRVAEPLKTVCKLMLYFYNDRECRYEEVVLDHPVIVVSETEETEDFGKEYEIPIQDGDYQDAVVRLDRRYYHYVRRKLEGDDAALAKDYTGYPAELDSKISRDFAKQRQAWFQEMKGKYVDCEVLEFAIELDNPYLYEQYLAASLDKFVHDYWNCHGLLEHPLAKRRPDRIYIGNQFCHNLIPSWECMEALFQKAEAEHLSVTLMFTYLREEKIEETAFLLSKICAWCRKRDTKAEIVVNDWGMFSLLSDKKDCLEPVLGVLLNKRRKDPRISYKLGINGKRDDFSENALNSSFYTEYLKKEYAVTRYEQESCGYPIALPEGKNSIHFPFYQTNTSQYCPLYARCRKGSRGAQTFADNCLAYCMDYVFSYPDHLHMVGRYNSLFGYDTQILTDQSLLLYYAKFGADRMVLNLM